jgi:hypothetical protein
MNFDELPLFRAQDTPTSRAGAQHVRLRLKSQQALLLAVYAYPQAINGLTDEEAGYLSGLAEQPRCCYWKRCSELRHKGLIRDTGRTREGSSGSYMMLCEITDAGLAEFGRLRMEEARQ